MQVERYLFRLECSGERLSNAKVTYPSVGNISEKSEPIPHIIITREFDDESSRALGDGLLSHQAVGRVTAYQTEDG